MHDEVYGHIYRGDVPILVATPHIGTSVPEDLVSQPAWLSVQGLLADPAGALLRAAAAARGISCIAAGVHPCVIDFNMPVENRALSSGLARASLCRTHTAHGESLYVEATEPSDSEVARRVERYWEPYHNALAMELQRLRGIHGNVVLLVSHAGSWLSPYRHQPDAFDCNVGTSRGASSDRRLVTSLTGVVQARGRSWVVNGRFADFFAAQHYGLPDAGIHSIEVEFAGSLRQDCERGHPERAAIGDFFGAMLDGLLETLSILPEVDCVPCSERAFKPYV